MSATRRAVDVGAPGRLGGRAPALASAVARWAAAAGLAALAAHTVASALLVVVRTHSAIPQADEWFSLALYDRVLRSAGLGDALRLMFEAHNEHRLFFPRLVFFADYLVFGGRGLLDKGVILLVQGADVGLFAWLAARSGAGRTATWALGGLAAALLFSLYQCENFVWAFQVQFVGVFACASLCCTAFAFGLTAERGGTRLIGAAFVLAVVATFTMANGLASGPVLVLLAALVRARPAVLAAAAAAAVASILLFSVGYRLPPGHEGAADLLRNLPRVAAFTTGYLGNFAPDGLGAQVALGAAGVAITLALAASAALGRGRDPARLALLGIALFCLGSAAITAVGRSRSGLDGTEASRYCTGAATFWTATLIHLWSLRGRPAWAALARGTAGALALYLLAACAGMQIPMGRYTEKRAADYGALGDALLLDLVDRPALEAFEEPVGEVRAMAPVLRRLGLSIFGGRDASLFGRPLSDAAGPGAAPMACAGALGEALADPGLGADGVAVAGTSSLRPRFGRLGRVYIVDAGGRIVGFARTGEVAGAWKGYARARPGDQLSAYALSDAGRVCRLGSAAVSAAPPG